MHWWCRLLPRWPSLRHIAEMIRYLGQDVAEVRREVDRLHDIIVGPSVIMSAGKPEDKEP